MTIGKVHLTKEYARYRVRNPKRFIAGSLRTQDIGRTGHSKRIAGRLRTTGKFATQAILIAKKDYVRGYRVRMQYNRPKIVEQE
jgi:hypothetical protein